MLIIRNNYAVAEAYAVHVMDIYDHYRWRNQVKKYGQESWNSLEENSINDKTRTLILMQKTKILYSSG